MRRVRDLGGYLMESTNRSLMERQLAERLRRALKDNKLSPEHVTELQELRQNCHIEKSEMKMQEVRGGGAPGSRRNTQQLVHSIIELGYLPTQCKDASVEEKRLAVQLIRAKKAGALSSQQEDVLRILAQDQAEATAGSGVH